MNLDVPLDAAQRTFGHLPGIGFALLGPRLLVQVKGESKLKIRILGSGYQVDLRASMSPASTTGLDVRRVAAAGEWVTWRVFSEEALRGFFAVVYPNLRQFSLRAFTSERLRDMLRGSTRATLADETRWEFWDSLAIFLRESPPVDESVVGSARRTAVNLARAIARGERLRESDLLVGSRVAEAALLRGFEPPVIETGKPRAVPPVQHFETIELTPDPPPKKPTDVGHVRNCFHGLPPGVCRLCGTPRARRPHGL
jgi:hypothetical protein